MPRGAQVLLARFLFAKNSRAHIALKRLTCVGIYIILKKTIKDLVKGSRKRALPVRYPSVRHSQCSVTLKFRDFYPQLLWVEVYFFSGGRMFVDCILLIVGIALLIKGADFFVSGASEIAKALKIPPLVIGLTLVSMGTSMPEASVSVIGAINGMNDMSVGNVVGSNIFNTLLIIGVSALITPIVIGKDVKIYDIPAMLGMYAVLLVFSFAISPYRLETFEAVILLLTFAAYTAFLIVRARKDAAAKAPSAKALPLSPCERFKPPLSLGIVLGGDFVVDGASSLAKAWGMSESLVGLTIVAAGTSLPELVTSAVASVKKENDIAVGNVIGSNIFNVVFILGLSSAISAPTLAATALVDVLVMLGAGVALAAVALLCKKVGRLAGAAFTAMYFGYLAYIIVRN